MMALGKRIAFVTGAGQGVGRGIALELAHAGANIVIADLNRQKGEEVVTEIKALGRDAVALSVDVTDKASIEQAIAQALIHFSQIDILVNNAGVMQKALGEQTSVADFDLCHEVNLKSIWLVTEALTSHFKAVRGGKIINISSAAGRRGIGDFPAYCASKAAAISLTQSLSQSLAAFDINVNAICPGLIWTPMWEQIDGMVTDKDKVDERKAFSAGVKDTPLGRPILPEDIGKAAVFLASDSAKNITGQSLNIDGGSCLN